MPGRVSLKELVEAFERIADDPLLRFVNLETGEIEFIDRELVRAAERGEQDPPIPEWQKREWEVAKRIVDAEEYFDLPSKEAVDEWQIMADFADEAQPESVRIELQDAIHGAGAFRMFRGVIRKRRLERAWEDYRKQALRQIALEWCEENEIPWKE